MPRYIIKPKPDLDYYVEWSTVVDNITFEGTRAEMIEWGRMNGWEHIEDRLTRTDEAGTSALWNEPPHPQEGSWEDDQLFVTNDNERSGSFWLRREDLIAYARGDSSVLTPVEDDEDEEPDE